MGKAAFVRFVRMFEASQGCDVAVKAVSSGKKESWKRKRRPSPATANAAGEHRWPHAAAAQRVNSSRINAITRHKRCTLPQSCMPCSAVISGSPSQSCDVIVLRPGRALLGRPVNGKRKQTIFNSPHTCHSTVHYHTTSNSALPCISIFRAREPNYFPINTSEHRLQHSLILILTYSIRNQKPYCTTT